ncbi:hypothetical protein BDQ12DRAFT_693425, partial [Crucibulum laeve]
MLPNECPPYPIHQTLIDPLRSCCFGVCTYSLSSSGSFGVLLVPLGAFFTSATRTPNQLVAGGCSGADLDAKVYDGDPIVGLGLVWFVVGVAVMFCVCGSGPC